MDNLIKGLALLGMLSLFSCSKVIYTQKQVLDGYKTKQDIIRKFGAPTEKRTGDTTEEWLYSYDGRSADIEHRDTSINVVNFTLHKHFVIFHMDMQGNVLAWQCEGMDFAKRKAQPGGTIALAVGGVAVIVVLVTIAMHSFTFNPGPIISGE